MSTVRQEAIKIHRLCQASTQPRRLQDHAYQGPVRHQRLQRRSSAPARCPSRSSRPCRRRSSRARRSTPPIADAVATAMKDWAIEKGATHYTHLFQPMTGITAEKHDSFLAPDGVGGAIAEFSGKELIKGEPDASSFPSGGLRATFEARGYTAWDPTCPAYIMENPNGSTLVIPTAFLSWTGEALDKKTPLLRSMEALSHAGAARPQALRQQDAHKVFTTVGPEQEYFLIDKNFYYTRPDLINYRPHALRRAAAQGTGTGRPIFRRRSPSACWPAWPTRKPSCSSSACRSRPATTKWPPANTKSPRSSRTRNLATDHQNLIMEMLRKTADKYGLACLLHEKPFAGINGSGKHNNWSMSHRHRRKPAQPRRQSARQRPVPGLLRRRHPRRRQVQRRSSACRSHRPTTITAWAPTKPRRRSSRSSSAISSTTSSSRSKKAAPRRSKQGGMFETGVSVLPKLPKEAGDRNRTSPFAFTGNKFEFRAVGSSAEHRRRQHGAQHDRRRIARLHRHQARSRRQGRQGPQQGDPGTAPRHRQGEQEGPLQRQRLRRRMARGSRKARPAEPQEHDRCAAGRHRARTRSSCSPSTRSTREKELESRFNILSEAYVKTVNIEAKTALMMAKTMILPAALRYQKEVGESIAAAKAAGAAHARRCGNASARWSARSTTSR